MANMPANSELDPKQVDELLDKDIPAYRQAYSDRTAWLMACLSELAYIEFNEKELEANLSTLRLELLETFDIKGTQAILVSSGSFIALAFRGTETKGMEDIITDAKYQATRCETGTGNIHTGFKEAFEQVKQDIQDKLNEEGYRDRPLFITGHSLGGALATIAVKRLSHNAMAACYTFGSPKVGDDEWIADIRTPIYRVVNASDCVTMSPPRKLTIRVFSWILSIIPWVGKSMGSYLLLKSKGYLHCGDMRYLTNCPCDRYDNVKVLNFVSNSYRIRGLISKELPLKRLLKDHSIGVYRRKLEIIARKRNLKSRADDA